MCYPVVHPNTISNPAGGNFVPDPSWKKDGSGLSADNSGYMRQYDMTADLILHSEAMLDPVQM